MRTFWNILRQSKKKKEVSLYNCYSSMEAISPSRQGIFDNI